MSGVQKRAEGIWQPYAECAEDECDWEHSRSAGSRDAAKQHVRLHGHSVRVVVERVAVWGPRP